MRLPFTIRDRAVQGNFDFLLGLLGGKIRFGLAVSVPTGGTSTVTHGLGKTPTAILLTPNYNGGSDIRGVVTVYDSSSFTIQNNGPLDSNFFWLAIAA